MSLKQKRFISFIEILGASSLYWILVWVLVPKILTSHLYLYLTLFLTAGAFIYFIYLSPLFVHKDSLASRGLQKDTFALTCKRLVKTSLAVAIAIILLAWQKESAFFIEPDWYGFFLKLIFYLFFAFIQDIIFFSFFFLRFKELVGTGDSREKFISIGSFALFFAFIHMPNIPLMFISFIFAAYIAFIFYTTANLYALVLVHAFLGTLLHRVYEFNMKVGVFYTQSHNEHLVRHFLPVLNDIIGGRW